MSAAADHVQPLYTQNPQNLQPTALAATVPHMLEPSTNAHLPSQTRELHHQTAIVATHQSTMSSHELPLQSHPQPHPQHSYTGLPKRVVGHSSSHNPTACPKPPSFNLRKVHDLRTRAALNLDNPPDPLPKPSVSRSSESLPWASAHLLPQYPTKHVHTKHPLAQGSMHSSKLVQVQLDSIDRQKFNPSAAIASAMLADTPDIRAIMGRITAKSLNTSLKSTQYPSLLPSNPLLAHDANSDDPISSTADIKTIGTFKMGRTNTDGVYIKKIPRAKKSVSQAWFTSLERKPNPEDLRPTHLEIDTISLPYPELRDDPFQPFHKEDPAHSSISSLDLNFEDYRLSRLFETPISISSFDFHQ
ncbi:hypothetical protein BASA50_006552 [Batrachochytrium salamandrivorans]|uniref:AGC-kinase C-terminal domain-containing protein n=1 Tax=Batrachochytrium salamandrivorans TaxID=1357716 RepID=A0ABQ8F9S1_9FUNG|nr:hypothetical protein BASA50_006552 [Batrachochytrium salamandrivorans]